MSANAAAASVAELPAKKPLPIGEATIKGRLQLYRRPQGNSQFWENLIILPAPDEYSSPATVLVLASRRLGERDDDVTVRVRIGGYRRSYNSTDRETGEIRNVQTADVKLFALED